jgi:hypothetical protein
VLPLRDDRADESLIELDGTRLQPSINSRSSAWCARAAASTALQRRSMWGAGSQTVLTKLSPCALPTAIVQRSVRETLSMM